MKPVRVHSSARPRRPRSRGGAQTVDPAGPVHTGKEYSICSLNSNLVPGDAVNGYLKEHARSLDSAEWEHHELLSLLHTWAEIIVREFHLGLEVPALRVDPISVRRLGTYRSGRNGFGVKHEITINSRHLRGSLATILGVLLHELLHEWQSLYGRAGKRNYHNREFRQKARVYGLVVDQRGYTQVLPGCFTALLSKHGVDLQSLRSEGTAFKPPVHGNSKMRKYRCACTTVRCAVELMARCDKCGQQFLETAPSW